MTTSQDILNQSQIPTLNLDQKQELIVKLSKLDFETLNFDQLQNLSNFISTLPDDIMIDYLLRVIDTGNIGSNCKSHLRQFKDKIIKLKRINQ